jgi:hypothetical protein
VLAILAIVALVMIVAAVVATPSPVHAVFARAPRRGAPSAEAVCHGG